VLWVPAAAIKITPVIGLAYLLARGRIRDAVLVGAIGAGVLATSALISPGAWGEFLGLVQAQGGGASVSILPVPFVVRLAAASGLALVAGRIDERWGEVVLIVALVIGNPSLSMTALAMLVAIVPLWNSSRRRQATATRYPQAL
jgi:hypothetical protein